jgi:hypothetical protein
MQLRDTGAAKNVYPDTAQFKTLWAPVYMYHCCTYQLYDYSQTTISENG